MPSRTNLYKGYSTFEFQRNKNLSLRDIELVKMDIINHIFTIKGSRVMMPKFGSNIPTMTFEPLDEILVDEVYTELVDIFNFDPRVEMVKLSVTPNFDTNTIYVSATLRYIELNTVGDFDLNIQFEG